MIKRILTVLLAVFLLTSLCVPFAAAADVRVRVVNMEDSEVFETSGLAASSAFVKSSKFSLRWGGADLNKMVTLPANADWSMGTYLEFWVYSTLQEQSSFGLGIISDNTATAGLDYYETVVSVAGKGWNLITLPLDSFNKNGKPLGFDKVSRVELWPGHKGSNIKANVELYIDSFYVTGAPTVAENKNGDLVLFDLTSQSGLAASLGSYNTLNCNLKKAPGKSSYALHLTDVKRVEGTGTAGGVYFNDMSVATSDFTPYNTLEISIYNKRATNDALRIAMRSDDDTTEANDYYVGEIVLDWDDEWKTVQFKLDSLSAGGRPLGWDKINAVQIWWYESDDKKHDSEVYIEHFILRNIDYEQRWQSPRYIANVPPMEDGWFDFSAHIKKRFPNNQHPRLLANQEELNWIRDNYKTDEYLKELVPNFLNLCNGYAEKVADPNDMDATSGNAAALALAYHLTGDKKYADACWAKWEVMTRGTSSWDPGGKSMLQIGDTSRTAAVCYDLMYNFWTEEQRMMARNAMMIYALEHRWGTLLRTNGAANQETNWNAIINSGVGMCALAIADDPGYEGVANQYLNRIPNALRLLFQHYNPDGSPFEGLDYWNYCMNNYFAYEEALYNTLGEKNLFFRFSMLDEYGMENSIEAVQYMHGPSGLSFNYFDGRPRNCTVPGDFFVADLFDRPQDAGRAFETREVSTYGILQYVPEHLEAYKTWRENMQIDKAYTEGEAQVGSIRTSWDAGNQGFYIGYKGNKANEATHGRLDAGCYVMESQGQRWVSVIDTENYNLPGMFGSQRYQYYRNRGEGMNTLVIGPGVHQGTNKPGGDYQADGDDFVDQKTYSISPIEKTGAKDWASYAILNLTDTYSVTADSVKRGFALIDGRNAFLLQDEITVKQPCEVYSFAHTSADIIIKPGAKEAILTKQNKKMKVTLLSDCDATLADMPAEKLPTSPDVQNTANPYYRKLAVVAKVKTNAKIALIFTPYYGANEYSFTMDEIVPIERWDTFLAEPIKLTGIYLDGVKLQDFKENKSAYSLKEDRVGTITATAAPGVRIEVLQAKDIGGTAVIKASNGKTTTTYTVAFTSAAQEYLDNYRTYPPKDYIYSTNLAQIPLMLDGDVETSWANEGSQWVGYDLGKPKPFSEVQLYWNNQHKRTETFDIQVSNDNKNWTTVWSGDSIVSEKIESYKFNEVSARYVKVTGYKNTANNWTSINEFYVISNGTNFDDVGNNWAKPYIDDMAKIGLIEGVADRTYSPDSPLSRAAFLTMLNRVYKVANGEYSGRVADIKQGDWYTGAIEGALAENLIPSAMLAGGFKPNQNITREEICALAILYYEKFHGEVTGASLDKFTDADSTSEWARPYVEKAIAIRLLAGMSEDTFAPAANATRAQAATFLKRIFVKTF